jgi:hypothetical protein
MVRTPVFCIGAWLVRGGSIQSHSTPSVFAAKVQLAYGGGLAGTGERRRAVKVACVVVRDGQKAARMQAEPQSQTSVA